MDRRTALKTLLALPAVQAVAVADLQPGDVIVIECDEILTPAGSANLNAQITKVWPDHKVIVFDKGFRMRIARNTVMV